MPRLNKYPRICIKEKYKMNIINQYVSEGGLDIPGLIGYWPYNSVDLANDLENGNDGVITGAILAQGRNGGANQAYQFDGINDVITVPAATVLTNNDVFTTSNWVYLSATPTVPETFFAQWTNGNLTDRNFLVRVNASSQVELIINDSTDTASIYVSAVTLSTGTWYHIATSHGAAQDKIYINSVEDLGASYSVASFLAGTKKYNSISTFGAHTLSLTHLLNGRLDDNRMYNRELNQSEINELYNE